MARDISAFAARIAQVGLASPNKFKVEFSKLPSGIQKEADVQTLNIMCESVNLAGRTIQSVLDRQYGINREVPYNGPTYPPLTIAFLCSGDYLEKKLFDRWNDKIVSIQDGWDVEYYDNYTGTVSVTALDRDGVTATHMQTYHECWPKSVASIELNHSTQNSALRMTVEMEYAFWETDDLLLNQTRTSGTRLKGQNLKSSKGGQFNIVG